MAFEASKFQSAIFDFVKNGTGNAILEAKAGSGKTTTILQSVQHIPNGGKQSISFVAFNNKIKTEIEEKLREKGLGHVQAKTFHGLGYSAWKNFTNGRFKMDEYKVSSLIRDCLGKDLNYAVGGAVKALVGKAKLHGLVPKEMTGLTGLMPDTFKNWKHLIEHYDIEFGDVLRLVLEWCEMLDIDQKVFMMNQTPDFVGVYLTKVILIKSIEQQNIIDFDDMLYMPVIYDAPFFKNDWLFIDEAQDTSDIRREIARMSLKPSGRLIAVGDTNQAIYGFAGANPESMALIKKDFNAKPFPLSISYRCCKAVIRLAKTIVPDIEAAPNAPEGSITDLADKFTTDTFQPTDMIICRNNSPLVALAFQLLREWKACKMEGRDIGKQFTDLVKRLKAENITDLQDKLTRWREKEINRITRKNPDASTEVIEDKYETIMAFISNCRQNTVDGLIGEINDMFVDTTTGERRKLILLTSAHRSKGLEAERVFILNKWMMPSRFAKQDWELKQEENIKYVAYTRAMRELYFIDSGTKTRAVTEE